jgi:hypothetical protein
VAKAALAKSTRHHEQKQFQPNQESIERVVARTGMEPERVRRFFEYVELEWLKRQPEIHGLLPYRVIEQALLAYFDRGQKSVTVQELANVLARTTRDRQPRRKSTSVYAISIPMGGDPHFKLKDNRR